MCECKTQSIIFSITLVRTGPPLLWPDPPGECHPKLETVLLFSLEYPLNNRIVVKGVNKKIIFHNFRLFFVKYV